MPTYAIILPMVSILTACNEFLRTDIISKDLL